VLTEDDLYDFLIAVTRDKDILPAIVRRMLTNSALCYIGHQIDERHFRTLLRSLNDQAGTRMRSGYSHLLQCEPQDSHRVHRYQEAYLDYIDISIYWGSAEDFVLEIQRRLQDTPAHSDEGKQRGAENEERKIAESPQESVAPHQHPWRLARQFLRRFFHDSSRR
jgi:hypothetical protein